MNLIDRIDAGVGKAAKVWTRYGTDELLDRRDFPISSSSAYTCIRQLWFAYNGQTEEEQRGMGFARRGDSVEAHNVEAILASLQEGEELLLAGSDQRTFVDTQKPALSTPDGVLVTPKKISLLEFKSKDPRADWSKLPTVEHVAQSQINAAIVTEQTNYKIDEIELLYTDASNFDEHDCFIIQPDGGRELERMRERAQQILDAKTTRDVPAEGVITGGCKYCPFRKACGAAANIPDSKPARRQVQTRDADGARLYGAAESYLGIQEQEELIKTMKAQAKQELMDILSRMGQAKVTVEGIEVTLSNVKGRETLDRKAMEAAGLDLAPFIKVGADSQRLTVKREE